MIAERSGREWTEAMQHYAKKRVRQLAAMDLSGYIMKRGSPSCGMERVRVYGQGRVATRQGRGLYARVLMEQLPLLPAEEEGRLNDPGLRENFVERVFAYQRWRALTTARPPQAALVEFHTTHKLSLLSHSEPHLRRLGRIVAAARTRSISAVVEEYGRLFMEALAVKATVRKHVNVMNHVIGFFSDELTPEERVELLDVIGDYHRMLVPLVVPLTLIRHYVRKFQVAYIENQVYLQPHPKELMLRNHV
jgi:uncharacterized protein YbgA (DUF1722 family)